MPRQTKRAASPSQGTRAERIYLAGQALGGFARQHRPGTDHLINMGLDAVQAADAVLHGMRLSPEEMRVAKKGGSK